MKKAVIRLFAVVLAAVIALGTTCAAADSGTWDCPGCGQTGNTGNFCSNCGTGKPAGDWTCASCGQTGNTGNFCTNCGASKPAESSQTAVNEWLEQIPGEKNKVKIRLASVDASDYISPSKEPNKWLPSLAVDGNETTCWQVSSKDGFKNNRIWLRLNTGTEQTVDAIWFKNGFWGRSTQGKDQNVINSKPRDITVEFLYSGESGFRDAVNLQLKDEAFTDWQRYDNIGHHEHVMAVKITIQSSYAGTKYKNDVCLSEVMLVRNAPAATAKEPAPQQAPVVYGGNTSVSGCKLLMKLATRTGPGTEYEEHHTYFINNWQDQTVKVLRKGWDNRNKIWWVQVEFTYKGTVYRLWTGKKRVDVDLEKVKESKKSGLVHVDATEAYAGPGTKYAKLGDVLFFEDEVEYYGRENGYVEIDYYDVNREVQRRVWVPEKAVSNWH